MEMHQKQDQVQGMRQEQVMTHQQIQALETADIVLMGDDLSKLPFAIRLSRRTLAVLRQNIGFSLAVKVAVLILVLQGAASLWMAVIADVGTSLVVILNGMRLLRGSA